MGDFKGVPQQVFADADKLFEESKFDEIVKLLKQQKDWENNERILWRLARCKSYTGSIPELDDEEIDKIMEISHRQVTKSRQSDDPNEFDKILATSAPISTAPNAQFTELQLKVLHGQRKYFEKAIKNAPDDPSAYLFLGDWHYSLVADFPMWARMVGTNKVGELPKGELDEALRLFEKAEEVSKDFDQRNKLMIAKTLIKLKRDKPRARRLLNEVLWKCSGSKKWYAKETFMEAYAYSAKLEQFV